MMNLRSGIDAGIHRLNIIKEEYYEDMKSIKDDDVATYRTEAYAAKIEHEMVNIRKDIFDWWTNK